MEQKTHWKKFHNPDFLGAYAFQPGQEIIATITKVTVESVKGSSGKADDCMVVSFAEDLKPLIANITNSKAIAKVAGSDFIEDWEGVKIQLYVTEVTAFGDTVQAVRVRPKAPKLDKPELTPDHPKWAGAVQKLAAAEIDISGIKKHFKISVANEKRLAQDVQALSELNTEEDA